MTTKYEQEIQSRTRFHYFMGGAIRFLNWLKYERARRCARRNGAHIGDNVCIPMSLARKLNSNVTIGDHTIIQTDNFSSMRHKITIGSHVIIGGNVKFVMGGHNIDSPEWENIRKTSPLVVKDYVWLCPDSVIMPSCSEIGYGAVVGANSVVVKDVPDMAVVSGFPAKVLRQRKCVHSDLVVESMVGGDFLAYQHARHNGKRN